MGHVQDHGPYDHNTAQVEEPPDSAQPVVRQVLALCLAATALRMAADDDRQDLLEDSLKRRRNADSDDYGNIIRRRRRVKRATLVDIQPHSVPSASSAARS